MTKAGNICVGIYTPVTPKETNTSLTELALKSATITESSKPDRKALLLAHIVATQTINKLVQEEDLAIPQNWQVKSDTAAKVGHDGRGRTAVIHSIAVQPLYQDIGISRMIVQSFIQRMHGSGMVDRLALLTEEDNIPFWKQLGFRHVGESSCSYENQTWHDMVFCAVQSLV